MHYMKKKKKNVMDIGYMIKSAMTIQILKGKC